MTLQSQGPQGRSSLEPQQSFLESLGSSDLFVCRFLGNSMPVQKFSQKSRRPPYYNIFLSFNDLSNCAAVA